MVRILKEAVLASCSVLSRLHQDILRKIAIKLSVAYERERIEMGTFQIQVQTVTLRLCPLSYCSIKSERFLTSSFTSRYTGNSPTGAMAFR
jgi:hypothetical protein